MPKFLSYLDKQLFKDLKGAAKSSDSYAILKLFSKYLFIILVGFIGISAALTSLIWPLFLPYAPNDPWSCIRDFVVGDYTDQSANLAVAPKTNEVANADLQWLRAKVNQMIIKERNRINVSFKSNNELEYTAELPSYTAHMFNFSSIENTESMDIVFRYGVNICPKKDPKNCFDIVSLNITGDETYMMPSTTDMYFDFKADEVIKDFTIKPYSMTGLDEYFYILNVETNMGNKSAIVYPAGNTPNTYHFVQTDNGEFNFSKDVENGIVFEFTPQREGGSAVNYEFTKAADGSITLTQ
jgi:hypothetical protein